MNLIIKNDNQYMVFCMMICFVVPMIALLNVIQSIKFFIQSVVPMV